MFVCLYADQPPVLTKPAALVKSSDDDIQVLETGIDLVPSSPRRKSKKPSKYIDTDSESGEGRDCGH